MSILTLEFLLCINISIFITTYCKYGAVTTSFLYAATSRKSMRNFDGPMTTKRIPLQIKGCICVHGSNKMLKNNEDQDPGGLGEPDLAQMRVLCEENERLEQHPCTRICKPNDAPMSCYYKFEIEKYYTMSKACFGCPWNKTDCFRTDCVPADGVERLITVVNRKLPGTGIQVCLGDRMIIDVVNLMAEETTTIHWHGHHQKGTPYMDGVPFITQCPIAPGTTFRYHVNASMIGTHFYHSHTGTQRADGLFGPFVIRQPHANEIHTALYDHDFPEHVIIISDWIHRFSTDKFQSHYQGTGTNKADSLLVNGMGKYQEFTTEDGNVIYTPLTKFNVVQGKRYRFRIINAAVLYCPIELSVDNHTLIIMASDGIDIQPVHVESLVTYAGERWDFIIHANNNVSNYWFKFKGLMDCKPNKVFSLGVLHYKGASRSSPTPTVTYETASREGLQLNPVNRGPGEVDYVTAAELSHVRTGIDPSLKSQPDVSLILSFDFYPVDHALFERRNIYGFHQVDPKFQRYTPQVNHVSLKMPSFPILTEPEYINANTFCTDSQLDRCNSMFCYCTYKIDLPLNAVVELTFVDEGLIYESNHPMHLHGHSFRVVSMEKLGNHTTVEDIKEMDRQGKIYRNLYNPPLKDTVTVPDGGFTIIRFYTTNPGYWLLHCHLDFHVEIGMAVILKVGDIKDFPPIPKNLPKCGDYYRIVHNFDSTEESIHSNINDSAENYIYHTISSEDKTKTNFLKQIWNDITYKLRNSSSTCIVTKVLLSLPAFTVYFWKYYF